MKNSQNIGEALKGLKPALLMVVVQFVFTGVNVLYKLAVNDGMNFKIIVAYRYIFSTAFVLPLALFIERSSRPKLTWTILFQSFLCGLFGVYFLALRKAVHQGDKMSQYCAYVASLSQNLYLESLILTSATFASAMTNLIPAITFILAVLFRLEKLNFGNTGGKAKVLGSLLGVGGALILTFYKGVEINIWSTHVDLLHHDQHKVSNVASSHAASGNHVLGCLLAVGSSACFSMWFVIQAKMSEKYPCYYSSTALMSIMASIQTVIFALCTEKDWSQWKLGWNIRLLTVAYSGILASGLMITLVAWCVHKKGPLYVSVFNPLLLVLVAIAGSLVLNEKLHLGSVLAAVLIVFGLYLVLWGKGKDMKIIINTLSPSESFKNQPGESVHVVVTSIADNTITWSGSNSIQSGRITKIAPDDAIDIVVEKEQARDNDSHA